ncbi:hypothetical protein [Streptomyces glaucus]|uniref:Secreted protein n=1 Tax=Streptomyces glaucus TaxID=284029 RepID=A0ABN3J4E3_9ACTN
MRKFQKAAVVVAMVGSVGALGAPTALAADKGKDVSFEVSGGGCKVESDSIAILSNVGILNGGIVSGILHFGEDQDGAQKLDQGNTVDCSTRGFTG